MMKSLASLALTAGTGLFLWSCSQRPMADGEMRCQKNCDSPAWTDNIAKFNSKSVKAFGGISKLYTMEQRARSDAEVDATKRALDELGIYGTRRFKEVVTHSGISSDVIDPTVIADEITQLKSEGTALGSFSRYQTQEWTENRDGTPVTVYKVYALYEIDQKRSADFLKKAMRSQLEEMRAKNLQFDRDRAQKLIDSLPDSW